jgi:hypothetical protein
VGAVEIGAQLKIPRTIPIETRVAGRRRKKVCGVFATDGLSNPSLQELDLSLDPFCLLFLLGSLQGLAVLL